MLSRLFMLDMKNTLDNKKSQNNRQVKRKEREKRVNKNTSEKSDLHILLNVFFTYRFVMPRMNK